LISKNIIIAKSKEVKTGCNLSESSKLRAWLKKGCFAKANDDDPQFRFIFDPAGQKKSTFEF
jgi:hypothetical protein